MVSGAELELHPAPHTRFLVHTVEMVHTVMLLQICKRYRQLPEVSTMALSEIRFWYDGIRGDLLRETKPRK